MALILDGTNGLSDVDGTAGTPAIRGSDANTGIFFPAADTIAFAEGGVESMRLDSNGNVGIGTSSPSARLDINRAFSGSGLGGIVGVAANPAFALTNTANYGWPVGMLFRAPLATGSAPSNNAGIWAEWQSDNNAYLGFATNGAGTLTERARIDSSGRLVVGRNAAAINSRISCFGAPFTYMCSAAGVDGNYERMFTYGFVSDLTNDNPTRENFLDASITAGAASANQIRIRCYSGGGSGSPVTAAFFTGAGTVFNGTNSSSWNTTSDARIKENVADLASGLDVITRLRPVTFDYTETFSEYMDWSEEKRTGHEGFIAQEYAQVLPQKVRVDDASLSALGISDLMGISQGDLIPYLVKAIQEQQAIIQSLTARIEALENQT